jgi:hypothetical protein
VLSTLRQAYHHKLVQDEEGINNNCISTAFQKTLMDDENSRSYNLVGKTFQANGQAHYSTDAFSSVHSPTYTHKLGQDGRKKFLHTSKRKWCISIYLNKPTLILQANCQAHYSTDAFSSVHSPTYTHKLGQDARNEIKKPFVKGDGMFK